MGRKYFGTDGVRGTVGEAPITPDFVMRLGYAAGTTLVAREQLPPGERRVASAAAALLAVQAGARIVRVHDVAATRDALAVLAAVQDHWHARERPDWALGSGPQLYRQQRRVDQCHRHLRVGRLPPGRLEPQADLRRDVGLAGTPEPCWHRARGHGHHCGEQQRSPAHCLRPWLKPADKVLSHVTGGGELIIVGGSGNGYRL